MVTLGTASSGSDKSAPMVLVWRGEAAMSGGSRSEKRHEQGAGSSWAGWFRGGGGVNQV